MSCPSFETLALYSAEQLGKEAMGEISRHLAEPCGSCSERLGWYKEAVSALRAPLEDGPDSLLKEACALFEQSVYAVPKLPGVIFATLVFDSADPGSRIGARSAQAASETSRRFLFHADLFPSGRSVVEAANSFSQIGFDIDVAIKRASDSNDYIVRGQIMFEKEAEDLAHLHGFVHPFLVELYKDRTLSQFVSATKFGEFTLNDVKEGNHILQIKTDKWITVVHLPVSLPVRSDV